MKIKFFVIFSFLFLFFKNNAQGFKYPEISISGKNVIDFVPKNWRILDSTFGDLNKDTFVDFAIVLEHIEKVKLENEFSDIELTNPRILVICFYNNKSKKFELIETSNTFILKDDIPNRDEPFQNISIVKGVFKIDFRIFMNSGGWHMSNNSYRFRFQENVFKLIGADDNSTNRGSGEVINRSYNFLTKNLKIETGAISLDKFKTKQRKFVVKELKTFKTFKEPFTFEVEKDIYI